MAIITYPLNGIKYNAEDAETYLCTRKSGVYFAEDNFKATVTDERVVTIGTGMAWINNAEFAGKSVVVNAPVALTIPVADGSLPRIDRIVLRFDKAANASSLAVKTGTAASSPAAPDVQRDELVYELGLYTIAVGAASLTVNASDVVSTMLDPEVCGVMSDGVTTVPSVSGAQEGNIPVFDNEGNIVASNIGLYDFTRALMTLDGTTLIITTVDKEVAAIVITKQPADATCAVNDTVVFSVEAVGDGLAYQWEASTNGGANWVDSSAESATTAALTLTAKSYHNGYMYRCLITDANGNTRRTNVVTLTVTA